MSPESGAPGIAWIAAPIAARVVRAGRRKEEDVHLIRRIPCALPVLDDLTAPALATVDLSEPFAMAGLSQPVVSGRWSFLGHTMTLGAVRFDGDAWWRPVSALDGKGLLSVEGVPAQLAAVRDMDHLDWPDWPFAVGRKAFATARTPALDWNATDLRHVQTDLDAAMAHESARLSARYAVVGGVLHVRCREPVNEVVATGLSRGKVREVLVVPTVDGLPGSLAPEDTLQVFRADASAEAVAYAGDMAEAFRCGIYAGRAFSAAGTGLERDERARAEAEAHARLVTRGEARIGAYPRPVVEAWMDLRDASGGGPVFLDALADLAGALLEGHRRTPLAAYAWAEAARLVPDRFVRRGEEMPPEDVAAFAAV